MIARQTGFGYSRIIGELRKLGIRNISRRTLRHILKEEGVERGPERTTDTWKDFLNRHGETLWGCDFFSVTTVTKRGLWEMYVLVFLCQQTREAIVSPATEHPNSAWVVEQTKAFLDQTSDRDAKPKIIIHDRDKKFNKQFTETLTDAGVKTNPLPKASPDLNGRCERIIGSIKWECLDKFVIFGKRHLDYLLKEFVAYYNETLSHIERDHLPPIRTVPEEVDAISINQVVVKSHVGELVKSFTRKAA